MTEDVPWIIKMELIAKLSINAAIGVVVVSASGPCWMDPIIDFLVEDRVLDDEKEASRIRRVTRYWLLADCILYWRSFGGPYLLCLCLEKVNELLAELHDRVCGSHVGGYSLAYRATTKRFWWPQMQKDAIEYVRKYEQCQKHALLIHQPVGYLNSVNSPWPFA